MKTLPTTGNISPLTTCNNQKYSVATQTERYINTDEYDSEKEIAIQKAADIERKIIQVMLFTVYAVPTFIVGLAIGAAIMYI